MAVKNIPEDHHFARHCKNRLVIRDNGVAVGVFPELFYLRPANPPQRPEPEKYFSGLYYEHFTGNATQRKFACLAALSFQPKANDELVIIQVSAVKQIFGAAKVSVRVLHEPKKACQAYASVRPAKMTNALSELLAKGSIAV